MSIIQDYETKGQILDEIKSMTLQEFQSLLHQHRYEYDELYDHINVGIEDMVQILFEERANDN